MKTEITLKDTDIMAELQGMLPLSLTPFADIAKKLGIEEREVIDRIRDYGQKKYYRRFGATLRHHKAGFKANGMGIWSVPEESRRQEVGEKLAAFTEVSHAYERPSFEGWPYHLFTMIHGQTEEEVRQIAKRMSEAVGVTEYDVLFSIREFKKTSMRYFDQWPGRDSGQGD